MIRPAAKNQPCARIFKSCIASGFNPRYPDFPSTPTNAQAYLQPFDPTNNIVLPQQSTSITLHSLLLINPLAFSYYNSNINTTNNNSVTSPQSIKIKCSIYYFDTIVNDYVSLKGTVANPAGTPTFTYSDCTSFGSVYGTTSGVAQYLYSQPGFDNRGVLLIYFYYEDSEGFLLYNSNTGTFNTGQPSSTNPMLVRYSR